MWYRLRWPREVQPNKYAGLSPARGIGRWARSYRDGRFGGQVEHRLALPEGSAGSVVDQLRAAISGLAIEEARERPVTGTSHAVGLRLTTSRRPLRTDDMAGSAVRC